MDFLSEQRRATGLVETAEGAARVGGKWQPPRCSRKTQDKFARASMAKKLLHCCIGAHTRVHMHFCGEYAYIHRCCARHACAGVYVRQMLWTSAYTFASRSLQDVHMHACMCSLFPLALGNEDGGLQLVYESTCRLAWWVIFDRRKDRSVVCVFSIFNAGGSVGVCVCIRTHTHTAQMRYLDVSPGVGMRHLEGPKNPDGLNLDIHIFAYVYKLDMCMYMLGGRMRSWTNCFFLQHMFSSEKEKQKMWTQTTDYLKSKI